MCLLCAVGQELQNVCQARDREPEQVAAPTDHHYQGGVSDPYPPSYRHGVCAGW